MMPVEQQRKPAGATVATGTSAGIGGVLAAACSLLPTAYKDIGYICIPVISPIVSFIGILLYNKFIEDPTIVEYKAKLKRDLVALRSVIEDDFVDSESKDQARKDYSRTKLMLANLGRAQVLGKIQMPSQASASTTENLAETE